MTNKLIEHGQAYSTSVLSNGDLSSAASELPYAHTEIPKIHSCHQIGSMLPTELKPILYDDAFNVDTRDETKDSMLYQIHDVQHLLQLNHTSSLPVYASVAGQTRTKVHVLIDSGATDNYVSSEIVSLLRVDNTERVYPPREVETADGNVTKIKNKVTFGLSINGEYQCQVTAYVFPTKFDLILGRTWLKQHSPRPVWETDSYLLGQEPHVVEIKPVFTAKSRMPELNYLITHKQADRELKHGGTGCLLYIKDIYEGTSSKADTKEQQQWIDNLIKEFDTVFRENLPGLPPKRKSQHVIQLENENCKPVNRAPFRMSPAELDELRRQLKELLDLGLIRPSTSPWGAPVLFVRKKDGKSLRMCIDYRALNKLTVKNRTYLPRIDECLDKLQGASYFTCLDLRSSYFQIRLQESDVPYTAFNSRYGKFEWLVLAQGLTNAPLSFQTQMNDILGDCIDKFALCYLDDVCIYSKTLEEHQQHVREVLERFKKQHFVVNKEKCKFAQRKLVFLGYQISQHGILPSPSKVEAVSSWPRPKNVQEVRQFIGLAQHYRRFIPGFASIAAPLTDLTRGTGLKRRFIKWNMECETSFARIKKLLTEAPVLQLPDMNSPYRIETDSSDFGIGAVLLQPDADNNWHPVAYESKKLSEAERKYPAQEREQLAIIHALRTWRCFVDGCPAGYTVVTDHQSLQYLMSQERPAARLYRWMVELAQFSPDIVYKSGSQHIVPDALSRIGGPSVKPAKTSITPAYINTLNTLLNATDFKEELEQDWPMLYIKPKEEREKHLKLNSRMLKLLAKEENNIVVRGNQIFHLEQHWVGGCTTLKEVPYVPFVNRLDLVSQYHEGFGHASARNLGDLLRLRHWWPTMKRDISFWIKTCPSCQINANKSKKHHGEMHPLTVPKAFERWHLDFIGELPMTIKGNKWIITAVDSLTNWCIARAVPVASAEATADFIYEEIMMRFGCPVEIVTDRGSQFKSNLVKAYSARVGVKHKLTSAFHPRTNSKVERFNGIIKPILRKYVNGAIHRWDDFLDTSLWACRIRTHTTTGFSPFFLTYGRDPRLPGDPLRPYIDTTTAKDPRTIADFTSRELEALGQYRAAAEFRLEAMAEKDKTKWDAAIKPLDFEPGDMVLITNEGGYSLEPHYKGPFIIMASYPDYGTYKLETVNGEPLDGLVHVDRLKFAYTVNNTKPSTSWYEPSSTLRRPTEMPSYYISASARPMNKPLKATGGGETSKQPPTLASEAVIPTTKPLVNTPTSTIETHTPSIMSVTSSRRSSLHSQIVQTTMEYIQHFGDFPHSHIILEHVALESFTNNSRSSPSNEVDLSGTKEQDMVIKQADNAPELKELGTICEDTIMSEPSATMTTVTLESVHQQPIALRSNSSEKEDIDTDMEIKPLDSLSSNEALKKQQKVIPVGLSSEEFMEAESNNAASNVSDTEVLEHDLEKEKVSKTTGLTILEEDRIVAKLVEVIIQQQNPQRAIEDQSKTEQQQHLLELERKDEHIKQLEEENQILVGQIEKESTGHRSPDHEASDLSQHHSERQQDIAGPSSSNPPWSAVKRPLEKSSDSDAESNSTEKQGVSGATPILGRENVIEEVDVPWLIKNWNKNKKKVFKPNKLVKRLKKLKPNQ